LDVIVGYEAISKIGKLAWYKQPEILGGDWEEHIIANDIIGPMSLSVLDMDFDGDIDVVVGEHNLEQPLQAGLFWFENKLDQSNSSQELWQRHVIYRGDEHHDGALAVDIDKDGDIDVISIGWSHGKVVIYRNPEIKPNPTQLTNQLH